MKRSYFKEACLFLLTGMLLAVQPATSEPISRQKALQNAREFLKQKGIDMNKVALRRAPLRMEGDEPENAPYHVFNIGGNDGFVIASGDDCAYTILGYSDFGSFDADYIPDGMKALLDFYAEQIRSCSQNPTHARRTSSTTYPAVEAMLTTSWGQDQPYNANCPIDPSTNKRCVTGCVATAMAQLMYYYRKYSTREITIDIPPYYIDGDKDRRVEGVPKGTPIDWDNMLDNYKGSYTEVQEQAVANLMLYCGTAVHMGYGSSQSGAWDAYILSSFTKFYDYDDDICVKYRSDHTDAEWETMVYEELGKGRPIYYSASGHAFIVDGHDGKGYVHINWGWNGWKDNYFLLSATATNKETMGGYNHYQDAIFGAVPNGAFPRLTTKELSLTSSNHIDNLSSCTSFPVSLSMTVDNLTEETHTFEQAIGLYKQGKLQSVVSQMGNIANMASGATKKQSVSFELEASLTQGAYTLVPISRLPGSDKWRKNGNPDQLVTLSIYNGSANLTVGVPEVEGDIITFACDEVRDICVQNWDLNGDGALSKEEAAAVTSLDKKFNYKTITSFDELQYFTGLTAINRGEFYRCDSLVSVVIPPNVKYIGDYAFKLCNLKNVIIHRNVTSIGEEVWAWNSNLESIRVESGNAVYDSRNECRALIETATNTLVQGGSHSVIPEDVVAIGPYAFTGCKGLKSIRIPNSVTSIGMQAFWSCSNLTSTNLPEGIKNIDYMAFSGCSNLTEIIIPSSVTSMGEYAFDKCPGLTSVTISNGVMSLGYGAFQDCTGLTSITIPSSMTSIAGAAFSGCTGLTSFTIPSSVTSIDGAAFRNCTGLISVKIPESVTSIGLNPFYGCNNLQSIVVDAGNTCYHSDGINSAIIETATSKLVTGSARTVIPDGIVTIGPCAFYNCIGLTSITIPSTVTSIERCAFYKCTNLTSITLPQSLTSIEERAFTWCTSLTTMTIPSKVTNIGESAFTLCSSLTSVNIPSGVTKICAGTFSDCTSLTSVNIPYGVTEIGKSAFESCKKLTSVTIPSTITKIDRYAFAYCNGITSIKSYITNVFETGNKSFDDCLNATLYVPKGLVETYKTTPDWNKISFIKEIPVSYDVNGDGSVDVSDVVSIVSSVLGTTGDDGEAYDVNTDGKVDVSDVVTLVNVILGK